MQHLCSREELARVQS
uniref:Uncharacterized protein n=1 Tax=Arundo donax TaxID=35708 RepID=A0A0A9B2P1_ARUDO